MKGIPISAALVAVLVTWALPHPASAQTLEAKRGTVVDTILQAPISSKTSHDGDTFQLLEKDGLIFHHAPAALKGATIDGHLENVTPAGPTHKATMTMIFDDVKLANGTTQPIAVKLESLKTIEPHTHHIRDVGLILGGAVAGHMMAGQHHGGLAGAAGGFALASALKSDIVLKRGTLIQLKLTQDLTGTGN